MPQALREKEGASEPNRGPGSPFPQARDMTLRRESIVTVLALLVIAAAIPWAIVDTLEKGRVYLFS